MWVNTKRTNDLRRRSTSQELRCLDRTENKRKTRVMFRITGRSSKNFTFVDFKNFRVHWFIYDYHNWLCVSLSNQKLVQLKLYKYNVNLLQVLYQLLSSSVLFVNVRNDHTSIIRFSTFKNSDTRLTLLFYLFFYSTWSLITRPLFFFYFTHRQLKEGENILYYRTFF